MTVTTTSSADPKVSRSLVCAIADGAKLLHVEAHITGEEERKLCRSLDLLVELGILATYAIRAPAISCRTMQQITDVLRRELGPLAVDACSASVHLPAEGRSTPSLLVPVWPFEPSPSNPDLQVAIGTFSCAPMEFYALPMDDPDFPVPLPSVARDYGRWTAAINGCPPGTTFLGSDQRPYVIFANLLPA